MSKYKLVKKHETEQNRKPEPAKESKFDNFIVYFLFWFLLILVPVVGAAYASFLRYKEKTEFPDSDRYTNIKTIGIIVSIIYITIAFTAIVASNMDISIFQQFFQKL